MWINSQIWLKQIMKRVFKGKASESIFSNNFDFTAVKFDYKLPALERIIISHSLCLRNLSWNFATILVIAATEYWFWPSLKFNLAGLGHFLSWKMTFPFNPLTNTGVYICLA